MNNWLRTNEFEEAVSALEMITESATFVSTDVYRWKWVILALHSALQGFMVLALRRGNGLLALKDKIAQEWLEVYRKDKGHTEEEIAKSVDDFLNEQLSPNTPKVKYPKEELDNFLNLYKKIKSNRMCFNAFSRKFIPQGTQGRSARELNKLRNKFIHFLPRSWALEVSGLPDICLDCLDIINFLVWESGNIDFHEDNIERRIQQALENAQDIIKQIKGEYLGQPKSAI